MLTPNNYEICMRDNRSSRAVFLNCCCGDKWVTILVPNTSRSAVEVQLSASMKGATKESVSETSVEIKRLSVSQFV